MTSDTPPASESGSPAANYFELLGEQLQIQRRNSEGQTFRIETTTHATPHDVEEELTRETIDIERVVIDRIVECAPDIRHEGDVMIVPVMEEVLVLERRLVLKEEVWIRRRRTTEMHRETVQLRHQTVEISSTDAEDTSAKTVDHRESQIEEKTAMTEQTLVAVYDTPAHAELAVQDLLQAGIPETAIHRHAQEGSYAGSSTAFTERREESGFWSSLFGGEPDHDTTVYDRSVSSGSSAVTVRIAEEHVTKVMDILEVHTPIDIDERAGSYGLTQTTATRTPAANAIPTVGTTVTDGDGTIQLAEENLAVGKRVINRGTTRIRRFVVETPVEEEVRLRDEKVTIERRPVTDGRPSNDSFSDKVIEMTESAEEVVVSKTARVIEEINIRKEANERTETVRDTVRREDVEITKVPGDVAGSTYDTGTRKTGS